LAKSHYSFKKRKKELERKLKQERKRQRKLDKTPKLADDNSDEFQGEIEKSSE
jgi:hypothetical protein